MVKVRGDYPRSEWALSEAAEIFEELGDRSGAAWCISQQGDIARAPGQPGCRSRLVSTCAFHFPGKRRSVGFGAGHLTDLAYIDCEQGNNLAAHAACCEALEIFAGLGHRRGIARALEGSACLALAQGYPERALKLAAAAEEHLRQLISAPLHQAEQSKLEQSLLPAWKALNEAEGKRAWTQGSEMSLEQAIQYSLEGRETPRSG